MGRKATVKGETVLPAPDTTSTPQSVPARVLVADDNADITTTIAMLLELEGYHVKVAITGAETLAIAEEFSPHVILLDIKMPGMDGYEICQRIKSYAWGASICVIAQSGLSSSGDRERALGAGFSAYLAKPYSPDELHTTIRNILADTSV